MCEVSLRQASIHDLQFVLRVQKVAMAPATIKVHGSWDDELQKKNTNEATIGSYEIISHKDEDLGALQVFDKGDHLEFNRIYVLPAMQSRGIGSLAINKVVQRAKQAGKSRITAKVFKTNERAIDLYKRLGCNIAKETEFHYELVYFL